LAPLSHLQDARKLHLLGCSAGEVYTAGVVAISAFGPLPGENPGDNAGNKAVETRQAVWTICRITYLVVICASALFLSITILPTVCFISHVHTHFRFITCPR
jgi:hypothetical protein